MTSRCGASSTSSNDPSQRTDQDRFDLGDTLIAGTYRNNGARIVSRESHFERIEGLAVESY